ncbi:hypothetical protein K457DRAFT_136332 [Linnemannia elongata AG-77]|uniref:Arrestin-like N-terminal domain-containing protein n=1 Tax=Linnemannia elongata AG-77 TaxID=1314771 RepID=A0A197K2X1_9FUNG|nr:hypothetical protein K457DRAFT_136332 [Linnemannia elongata AG-77]
MGRHSNNATDGWFTIQLNDPYITIPDSSSSSSSSSNSTLSDGEQGLLTGTVLIRVSKPTKVKSLSLTFAGVARTTFYFDSSRIPGARTCVHSDKHQYECTLIEQTELFLSPTTTAHTNNNNNSHPHVLPAGTHRFAFTFTLHDRLPAVISSRAVNIQYRLTASLHTVSFLPFSSPHIVSRPVVLLQRDELPSDDLFNTAVLRIATQNSSRLLGHVSIPCSVIPQSGTIPLNVNLGLKGNASSVTKITIELLERILAVDDAEDQNDVLFHERLVTRQNCPLQDWPGSTLEEPVVITKRLLFKVPQLPLSAWSSVDNEEITSLASYRAGLEKGLIHASGDYRLGSLSNNNSITTNNSDNGEDRRYIRIRHLIRFTFQIRGLTDPSTSSSESGTIETESLQKETDVWIIGNQEYREDDTLPPSYYRSFSTTLVDSDKIPEMDQRAIEALQDDIPDLISPPRYEDCLTRLTHTVSSSSTVAGSSGDGSRSSSVSSSPTLASWRPSVESRRGEMMMDRNISHFSLNDSLAESHSSQDTFAYDLQAYSNRYSHASPVVVFAT